MSNGWDAFVEVILGFFRGLGGEPESDTDVPVDDPGGAVGAPVVVADEPGPESPLSPGGDEPAASGEGGDTMLKGKGVWAYRERELDRAIQIAPQMGATHVLYKVAHGEGLKR